MPQFDVGYVLSVVVIHVSRRFLHIPSLFMPVVMVFSLCHWRCYIYSPWCDHISKYRCMFGLYVWGLKLAVIVVWCWFVEAYNEMPVVRLSWLPGKFLFCAMVYGCNMDIWSFLGLCRLTWCHGYLPVVILMCEICVHWCALCFSFICSRAMYFFVGATRAGAARFVAWRGLPVRGPARDTVVYGASLVVRV